MLPEESFALSPGPLNTYYNIQIAVAQNSIESKNAMKPIQLKLILRNLWLDHSWCTRNYIISFVADILDAV
jgi:hypothetical protein